MHCILHVGWTNFNFSVKSPNKVICLRMRIIHIRENKFSYPDLNLEKLYGTSGSVSRIDIPTLLRVSMKQNLPFFSKPHKHYTVLQYLFKKKTKHKKPLCIMFCNSLHIFLYRPVIGSGYECGSWLFITVLDLCHFVRIRIRLNQSDQNLLKIVLNSADWTKLREKLGFWCLFLSIFKD